MEGYVRKYDDERRRRRPARRREAPVDDKKHDYARLSAEALRSAILKKEAQNPTPPMPESDKREPEAGAEK